MRQTMFVAVFMGVLLCLATTVAQSPAAGTLTLKPIAPASGTGVSNASLLDRPEVRVLRVDIAPGGVRNVHTHDDTEFHLFIPVAGTPEFQAEPGPAVALAPWQAQFVKGGTRHGFTNPGPTTATVIEVFVRKQ